MYYYCKQKLNNFCNSLLCTVVIIGGTSTIIATGLHSHGELNNWKIVAIPSAITFGAIFCCVIKNICNVNSSIPNKNKETDENAVLELPSKKDENVVLEMPQKKDEDESKKKIRDNEELIQSDFINDYGGTLEWDMEF